MKKLKYIFLTLFSLVTLFSYSQQSIGSFPTMNGGFESVTTGNLTVTSTIANATTSSSWTKDNASLTATINSTSPRTGTRYLTCQNTTATAYRIQSPTVNTNGAIANTTAYTVQYYYRTANATAVTNFQRAISPDGTAQPGTYGATTMSGTSNVWTKIQVSQTSGSSASVTKYGIGILRLNGSSAVSIDIDDYVIYAGAADNTAPSTATSPTITASSCTSLNVSWAAASGGVDGGGYMVVRGTTDPTTAPNTQGIYDLNGTLGSGTIVYIGTNTSFTDNSLTTNTTYYYRIYTLDKAFNYSSALTGNGTTSSPSITTNPSNITINNGSNTTFNVVATNSPSSYTWQVSTNGGSSWSNVSNGGVYSGATTATLTLTSADYTMNGYQYKVTTTNGCGSSTSTVATLTVNATIPVTGSNSYTMCSGILYDDGGTGNYSTYVSGYSVIYPSTSGSMVRVSGTLNVENGYDYITIYDGVGTSGTVLYGGSAFGSGTSCGNYTIPTITSTSGPLTVLFTSDVSGVCTGMVLNVSCFTPAYQAQITSINTGLLTWCSGEVRQVTVTVKNTGTATWTNSSPDINVGVKWNADADYFYRTDVGGLSPGSTQTYSINVTAPSSSTTSNLTFDLVYEGCFWFATNPGSSCGTTCQGNSVYTSPSITVNSTPATVTVTAPSTTICTGSTVQLTASGGATSGTYISGGLTTINGLTGAPAPLSNYFGGDKTQMLFTPSELTALGYVSGDRITSLGFAISTVGTTTSLSNFQIDYKLISGATTTLTSTFQTGLTNCKTSFTWTLPTSGLPIWSYITFDTPITWDGASSLVLQTCYSNGNTGSSSSSVQTYLSAIGANRCVYYRVDGSTFSTIFNNATGTTSSNRPDVRLGWTKNAVWSWSPVTSTTSTVNVSPTTNTTYTATSTASNGCTSQNNITINVSPTSVAGTASSSQTICSGTQPSNITLSGNTGTIQWQVSSDGTNFSDISGATSSPLTSAQMGTLTATRYYRAVVTSGVCSSINSNTITITVNPVSVAGTTSSNQTICSGTQPSNITLTGNVGNIQWQVSTDGTIFTNIVGATSSPLTSAQMGNLSSNRWYRAVVTSGVCSSVNSGTITVTVNPTSVSGTASSDQTICYGSQPVALGLSGNTGTIQWQVSTDNVSFSNILGATSSPLTPTQMGSLTSGRYYRAVVTSGVCSSVNSNTITITVNPTSVAGTTSSNQTICSGGQPSNITLSGNTGTIQWQVSSDNITYNDIVGSTSSPLTSVQMGALTSTKYYRAVVTSGVCSSINSNTITITVNSLPSITASGGGTVCVNSSQTLYSSVSGGTGTPSYQWQSCSTSNGTYSNITGATSSTYNAPTNTIGTTYYKVSVTYSGNGCGTSTSNTVSVTIPSSLTSGTHNTTALTICQGGNPASMTISTPTGGISPYTYQWRLNNSSITGETSITYNSPAMNSVGTFSINCVTTDACGTQVSSTPKIITVVSDPTITLQPVSSSTVCLNGSLTLSISATGGTPSLTYQWYSNTTASTTSGTLITGETSTTYNVPTSTSGIFYYYCKVSASGSGCSIATSSLSTVTITTLPSSTITSTNVSCNGGSNGSINLSVNNGTSPYTYSWSNGSTTQNLSGLQIGSYSVTITDINGCQSTNSVTITQPSRSASTVITNSVSCYGGTNGSITLSVTGGTTPYSFLWSNSSTTQNLSNLSAGVYGVTVTDANGCQLTNSGEIKQPTQLISSLTQVNITCNGGNNGSIDLTVSGGVLGYTYLWSNGSTTQDISNLSAGNYSVTITDGNGCQITNSTIITQPTLLTSTSTQVNPSCFGNTNGSINLTPSGGVSPYTFLWSNNQTTEDLYSLPAGTYSVTITDANNCQSTRTVTITQPAQLTTTVTTTNVNCYGDHTGSAQVTVSGGTSPYLYSWSTGSTQTNISNLGAGNYQVTVVDNKGCSKLNYITITQPSQLSISLSIDVTPNCGANTGVVSSGIVGGTSPYSYSWSNGQTTQNLTNATSGNYTLIVTDVKGCQVQSGMTLGCSSTSSIVVDQITGLTSLCGISSTTYTINYSNGTPSSITWTLPDGMTSTNGLNNSTVIVNIDNDNFIEDSIKVNVVSNGITYHRSIWVSKLPNKPIIAGNFCGEPVGNIKRYIITNSQSNTIYNWVPPYGVNVYSGQGNDTAQMKFSLYLTTGSAGSVTATNSCGSSSTQFKLYKYVVRPTSILGPATVCADGNTIYTYRVDSVPTSYGYIWSVPNGVSIIGTSYDDTLKVKFSTNFSSGQFSVMSVNQCGSSPMTYGTVSNNNLYTSVGTITGPGDLCPYLGQRTTYSVSPQNGTFTWSVPSGFTIQSGQGTNVVTVFVSNTFSTGTISVSLNNGCGGSNSSSKSLSTTTSTISASSISGVTSVCTLVGTNTSTTFSISPLSGVNYSWSVPSNSTIVSGQGTNSINVTFQNGFTGGNIQVVITGGCGNPITRTKTVNLGLPTVNISGVNCVDNGYTNTYSVSVTGAVSITWSVPGNSQIVRGQGTNSIDVYFPGNFESTSCFNNNCDSIRVTVQYACGNVISKKKIGLLTVRPTITGLSSACYPDTIRLTASISPRNTSYIWSNPNGTQFIGSTTGNTVSAKTTSSFMGGTFSVMGVNSCGSSPMGYFGVNKLCNTAKTVGFEEVSDNIFDFIVFPNPGKGLIELRIYKGNYEYYLVQVKNNLGQLVYQNIKQKEDSLDLRELKPGTYFIIITDKNGNFLTKQLMIM